VASSMLGIYLPCRLGRLPNLATRNVSCSSLNTMPSVQCASDTYLDLVQDGERAVSESLAKELLGMMLQTEEAGNASPASLFPSLFVRTRSPFEAVVCLCCPSAASAPS